ncbi:MAG: ABC transporter ATP-binding protein [Gemmatimonadota bacterium]
MSEAPFEAATPAHPAEDKVPLWAEDLHKSFRLGDGSELRILQGVGLQVRLGEAVAIVGSSGAGKSTLLHLLGALDRPSRGRIFIGGTPLDGRSSGELARIRNGLVGFVFQFHHLLREFSALENAMIPQLIHGRSAEEARRKAEELLQAVGLGARLGHRPWQLSGGEQQRVAVARALVNDPAVLLADEPSGNLDTRTSEELHDVLFRLREERGLSMVLVTHNRELAARADRTFLLREGVLSVAPA